MMNYIRMIVALAALSLLAACGSGGGSTPAVNNTVGGTASAGIIKGGTVKAFKPYSSATGADKKQIGSDATTSLVDGSYTYNLGSYSGPVVIEVTGGSYVDEADPTAGAKTIPAGAPLRAVISSASGSVSAAVTPLTELAVKQVRALSHTPDAATIDKANAQISDLFKVDIINTKPLDAQASITSGSVAEQSYTMALATISQLTKNNGQTLDAALASVAGTISTTGTMSAVTAANILTAQTTFVTSANNKTGLPDVPAPLKNIGTTTVKLTIALPTSGVKGIDTTINLPVGVTAAADTTGATLDSVFKALIPGVHTTVTGKFTAGTPNLLRMIVLSPDASIVTGDIVTATLSVAAGVTTPVAADFALKAGSTTLTDGNGVPVTGSVTLHL